MIYLVTGTPGTGKTSFILHMWLKNKNKIFTFEDGTPRPLYYNHIDGLDSRQLKAHEINDDELKSAPLNEILPEGAILIVDEADYIYPVRGLKAPPPYVQTLKELRHYGLTLILITQSPSMLDSYIRRLVTTHWHLQRRPLGTKLYEFNQCQEVLSESNLKLAAATVYKPDKNTFKLYQSASVHIKHKKKLNRIFYIFPFLVMITLFFIIKALVPVKQALANDSEQQFSDPLDNKLDKESFLKSVNLDNKSNLLIGTKASDFIPRLPDHPETAPIYDELRKPVNIELVVGCVKSGSNCNCYSSQATKVIVSRNYCEAFVNGLKFDAYRNRSLGRVSSDRTDTKIQN